MYNDLRQARQSSIVSRRRSNARPNLMIRHGRAERSGAEQSGAER